MAITTLRTILAARETPHWLLYFIIFILASYIGLDTSSNFFGSKWPRAKLHSMPGSEENVFICTSVEGHLPDAALQSPEMTWSAWNQMKWIGQPALCRVKGQLIESLDSFNNFRRGYSLRFATDYEDRTHLLPWLLGSKINLNKRNRRVYLDLGANAFQTSIQWFQRMYPCDFTEVHAFEMDKSLLRIPNAGLQEDMNWSFEDEDPTRVKEQASVPQGMLDVIKIYYSRVSDFDDMATTTINITRFIKQELKLTAADTVVVKMDIEGFEWPILERWIQDPTMADIIDELFVEIHYHHPRMTVFGWNKFNRTLEDATHLFAELRARGFYTHAWP